MAQRIDAIDDGAASPAVRDMFAVAEERGAPNSTLLRIMARDPDSLETFHTSWNRSFYDSTLVEHELKELMRVRMARTRDAAISF